MIFWSPWAVWPPAVWTADLSGAGEVVYLGDAEHGSVDAVALEAAVAEELPGLHAGEDVLDPGADLLVGLVVFLCPGREFGLARSRWCGMTSPVPG